MAPTLVKPPPPSTHLSEMETTLQLTPLTPFGPSIFTNTRPLWHPPNARGIYGGAAIAQSLLAAYKTLPSTEYVIHSMHCYFVLAGDSENPVIYHVERVRDGKGFVTRTVQARQGGRVIFTTTMSFMRRGAGGKQQIRHAVSIPTGMGTTCPVDIKRPPLSPAQKVEAEAYGDHFGSRSPFEAWRYPVIARSETSPHSALPLPEKRTRSWIRARGQISDTLENDSKISRAENGDLLHPHVPHACALAYMSDSYFIGTISRIHNLIRFSTKEAIERAIKELGGTSDEARRNVETYVRDIVEAEARENAAAAAAAAAEDESASTDQQKRNWKDIPDVEIGMMVTLDHTIYFHNPENFRADDWMFSEMRSPWAGDGRGLVMQHIWSREGVLIATCVQEGVVRLRNDGGESKKSKQKL